MDIPLKTICRFSAILSKSQYLSSQRENEHTAISTFMGKHKNPRATKVLSKKNHERGLTVFTVYPTELLSQNMIPAQEPTRDSMGCYKPDVNPLSHLSFDKDTKNIRRRKTASSINCVWETGYPQIEQWN